MNKSVIIIAGTIRGGTPARPNYIFRGDLQVPYSRISHECGLDDIDNGDSL